MCQEQPSRCSQVPLIHGPAEDAIEAQSAAVGPSGREAAGGSEPTSYPPLNLLVGRNGGRE